MPSIMLSMVCDTEEKFLAFCTQESAKCRS